MSYLSFLSTPVVAKGADTILRTIHMVIVSVISIAVVLVALIGLAVLISIFSKMMQREMNIKLPKFTKSGKVEHVESSTDENAEVIAAIALALKLHDDDLHDRESVVITINTVARAYSPWSSKIHGLTQMPR